MDVPRYSFIAAVNNIGRYLDRFIGSIEAQTLDWSEYEVVAVDDGSTDDSLDRLQRWAAERPGRVTVLSKENGGQSTARNLGIELARGEWLPFTGPDDVLNPTYVVEVDRFLDANPKVPMVATYRVFLDDATGAVRDTHPLRSHFAGKSKLRYLDGWPSHFHGSAPAAFFRGERIIEFGLRVDPDVRPNFEDGNFCVRYLLAEHRPAVGFVKSAVYQYRKRSDASSTLQTSLANPDRYTKVLRNGYRALLRQLLIGRSRPPEWLQNYVIYELSWYFTSQDARASTGGSATGSVAKEFQALMAEICPLLDAHVVKSFRLRRIPLSLRFILLHAYADRPWHSESALIDVLDSRRRLARVRYFFIGENPGGVLTCGGEAVGPAFAKDAPSVTTIGHCFESESCGCPRTPPFASSWTAAVPLVTEPEAPPRYGLSATLLRDTLTDTDDEYEDVVVKLSRRNKAILKLASTATVRRRCLGADGPPARRRRQRRGVVPLPTQEPTQHQRPVRHRGRHAGLGPAGGGRLRAGCRPRIDAVDAERPAPHLIARRRAGDRSGGDPCPCTSRSCRTTSGTSRGTSRGPQCGLPAIPRPPSTRPTSSGPSCTQFDAEKVLGGAHVGRRGYFDYQHDGFGPVTSTVAATEEAVVETVRAGRSPARIYRKRIDATFPDRDGRCCKRAVDAILASARHWQPDER